MKKLENLIVGAVFIVLGLVLGTNALGITKINLFFDGWWTLFIIIPCFKDLFKKTNKTGSLIGLLIGIALLLCCLKVLSLDTIWKISFPTILIIIGLSVICRSMFNREINYELKITNKTKFNEYCSTFSSQSITVEEELTGTYLAAIFGILRLDLKNAKIKENQIINCVSIFGGIDIFVPKDVKIKVKSASIFGKVVDNSEHCDKDDLNIIYVNATSIFGGVEIK